MLSDFDNKQGYLRGTIQIPSMGAEVSIPIETLYDWLHNEIGGIYNEKYEEVINPFIKDIRKTHFKGDFIRAYLSNGMILETSANQSYLLDNGRFKEARDLHKGILLVFYENGSGVYVDHTEKIPIDEEVYFIIATKSSIKTLEDISLKTKLYGGHDDD